MGNFNEKYENILNDIKETVTDEKQFKLVNKKMDELSNAFAELVIELTRSIEDRIEEVDCKVSSIEKRVISIENDIYEEDDGCVGVLCPYCNNEFQVELEENNKQEIKCPECNNIIELNWGYDDCDGCGDDCDCGCMDGNECSCDEHHCHDDEEEF